MSESSSKESQFGFDELFFSRTDKRGVILSGNSVFQRVSKYDWSELIQKPHSLIRHPAMPRGVFHLLWSEIQIEHTVAAYVVNQAKDGSSYWVLALVSPISDGYLSVRLKPSSALFEVVKGLYQQLLETEKTKKLSPEQSHFLLFEHVKENGFRSLDHFMGECLAQELRSRQKALALPSPPSLDGLQALAERGAALQNKCDEIFKAYEQNALVPLNLEVQAARLGQEGAPITIISSRYEEVARLIQQATHHFVQAGIVLQNKVDKCQFDICHSLVQAEAYAYFENEDTDPKIQKELEMSHLNRLSLEGIQKAQQSLLDIEKEFEKFKLASVDVKKLSTALDIVHISGKIEAAKISQSSIELFALLNDLGTFKTSLKKNLDEIGSIGYQLSRQTQLMKETLPQYFLKKSG